LGCDALRLAVDWSNNVYLREIGTILDSAFYASKFLILEVFLHETRKPEFRIGHLRLASNRNVTLRSAELPQRCANSSNIGQAIKCTFIDFETTLSGSASGIFVLHLDLEHAFDRA
jgi:hypothetical protein